MECGEILPESPWRQARLGRRNVARRCADRRSALRVTELDVRFRVSSCVAME